MNFVPTLKLKGVLNPSSYCFTNRHIVRPLLSIYLWCVTQCVPFKSSFWVLSHWYSINIFFFKIPFNPGSLSWFPSYCNLPLEGESGFQVMRDLLHIKSWNLSSSNDLTGPFDQVSVTRSSVFSEGSCQPLNYSSLSTESVCLLHPTSPRHLYRLIPLSWPRVVLDWSGTSLSFPVTLERSWRPLCTYSNFSC